MGCLQSFPMTNDPASLDEGWPEGGLCCEEEQAWLAGCFLLTCMSVHTGQVFLLSWRSQTGLEMCSLLAPKGWAISTSKSERAKHNTCPADRHHASHQPLTPSARG